MEDNAPEKVDLAMITHIHELEGTGLNVRFACIDHDYAPKMPKPGDVGYDLCTPHDLHLPYGCRRQVDTGVVVECPEPLFVMIVPRSSTGTKKAPNVRICNTLGVIDPRYRGQSDTLKVWLEREARKKDYIGTFSPKFPQSIQPLMAQAQAKWGLEHTDLEFIEVGKDTYDVFGYPEKEAPSLIYTEGEAFVQMLFLPVSRPFLERFEAEAFSNQGRGGFGSTGR